MEFASSTVLVPISKVVWLRWIFEIVIEFQWKIGS